jgi:hypothetical protein
MTLGGVLTGEQVRLRAIDGGGCWDLTEKMDDRHLRKNPLTTANIIHYSSSDTIIPAASVIFRHFICLWACLLILILIKEGITPNIYGCDGP